MTEKEKELTHEMLDLIERVKSKTDTLDKNNRIPALELNVILAKIEKLHQKAIVLKYLHQHADELYKAPDHSEIIKEEMEDREEEVPVLQEEITPIEEPVAEELEEPKTEEPAEISMDKLEADLSNLGQSSIADSQMSSVDVGAKLSQQPIDDIKNAIGINDKFLYINELFGGNSDEYNSMVEVLNNFNSMDQANSELQKFNWNKESETVQSFLSTVARRYI